MLRRIQGFRLGTDQSTEEGLFPFPARANGVLVPQGSRSWRSSTDVDRALLREPALLVPMVANRGVDAAANPAH